MGGQARVFYGAAQFSRDLDLLVLVEPENLALLRAALNEMAAEPVRCRSSMPGMSNLRGVDGFEEVWARRTAIETNGVIVEMLGLEDAVRAKKTQ